MRLNQHNVSLASSVNHGEDEPSMAGSSGPVVHMLRMISDASLVSKELPPSHDVAPGMVGSTGDITISSYTINTEDARSIGSFFQTSTAAPTSLSPSPRRSVEMDCKERYCMPRSIRHPTGTPSTFTAQHSGSATRNTLNLPQLLSLGAIFSNRADPHPGDARSFAKPTLDPADVRWCSSDQWMPDACVVNCMAPDCKMSFSLFTRKEHCKLCGRVFCSSCCSNEVEVLEDRSPCLSHSRNVSGNIKGSDPLASNGSPHPRSYSLTVNETDATLVTGLPLHPTVSAPVGSSNSIAAHTGMGNAAALSLNPAPTASCAALADNVSAIGASLPQTTKGVIYRVCNECFYETQLVISTRGEDGRPRRKCRGQLKMFQRVLLVNVLGFLPLRDLLETALVSSEFYFMSRDNVVWYQYNTARWLKETENPHFSFTGATNHMLTVAGANFASSSGRIQHCLSTHDSYYKASLSPSASSTLTIALDGSTASVEEESINFPRAPVLEDATALTQGEAFKRVISHHARYNYTQFLDFARRQEMARCEGLAWFSVAARVLLSNPIRVALIGPPGVGKTTSLLAFLRKDKLGSTVHPTMGFTRYKVALWMGSESKVGVSMEIYDVSGDERYEALRRFICSHCHAIGLCYNPCRKVTLVQAADVMMAIEPTLGPQPAVVCGLIPSTESNMTGMNRGASGDASDGFISASPDPRVSQTLHRQRPATLPTVPLRTPAAASSEASAGSQGSTVRSGTASRDAVSTLMTSVHIARGATKWGVGEGTHSLESEAPTTHKHSPPIEVSEEDAAGITVRGGGSLQCPVHQTHAFYDHLLYSLIDRLSLAVMANRTSIADLTEVPEGSEASRFGGIPLPNSSRTFTKRDPKVDKAIAEELLKLTMQPSALNVLLNR